MDTVGCLGGLSTFHCGIERNDSIAISWNVEGNTLTEETALSRGISVITQKHQNGSMSSELYIFGYPSNDNIIIGCTVISSFPPKLLAKEAVFTVVNPPPVTNLTSVAISLTRYSFSWNEPFCLPLNYSYIATIKNEVSSSVVATTDVSFKFELQPCSVYTVEVKVASENYSSTSEIINEFIRKGTYACYC